MNDQNTAILKLFADDKNMVPYRPKLSALLASPTAALLLGQICYWWDKMGGTFYKFKDICEHEQYTPGESWCESLGWTKSEFDKAIGIIGTKIKQGVSKKEILQTDYPVRKPDENDEQYMRRLESALKCLVIYWTSNNLTYYQVNIPLLVKCVSRIYSGNCETLISLRKNVMSISMSKLANRRHLVKTHPAFALDSKTTQETTLSTDVDALITQNQLSSDTVEEKPQRPLQVAAAEPADAGQTLTPIPPSPLSFKVGDIARVAPPLPEPETSAGKNVRDTLIETMIAIGKWDKTVINSLSPVAETKKTGKKGRSPREKFHSNLTSVANALIGMGIKADEIKSLIEFIRDMADDNEWSSWSINIFTGDKSVDHISAWRNAPDGKYVARQRQSGTPYHAKGSEASPVPKGGEAMPTAGKAITREGYQPFTPVEPGEYLDRVKALTQDVSKLFDGTVGWDAQ